MQTANRSIHDAQRSKSAARPGVQRHFGVIFAAFGILLLGAGCITAPPKKPTQVEQARAENAVGAELAAQFDTRVKFKSDPIVDQYLNGVARMLAGEGADTRLADTKVQVIQDRSGLWRTYSLPGQKVYLSLGLLQRLKFDNEVAAVIALEFGNLMQSHALTRLRQQVSGPARPNPTPLAPLSVPENVDFFSPQGLFSFDIDDVKNSIKSGIDILYKGGFDIRGMLQVWTILGENSTHSPFADKVLDELSDFTRTIISRYAPLRNPIVRTENFQAVHKRIMKL